ncbi:hypothetical protein [Pyrobaculum sp.]|uniref:hypothetical protein n=1 Tax=Pyrobaculum sp. TaxID=2004705 RepID=UPI003177BDDB
MDLSRFIDAAVDAVVRSGAEVVILTAPGSSRVEVAKRASARREGLRVVSYKEGGEGWVVARGRFVEEALGQIEKGGRWLVIPPDTTTANLLYAELRGKKLVEVLYLPEVYERVAKEARAPKEAVEAATVSHWAGGGWRSGISLKLLQIAVERPEEARRAVERIRALAPGRLGLGDFLAEAAKAVKRAPLDYLVDVLGGAASAIPVALAAQGVALAVLGLASAAGLAGVVGAAAGLAAGLAERLGKAAVKEPLARAAEWLLQKITGREEARNKFAQSLASFIKAVVEARQYVIDDTYESVVDEVAAQWGLDAATFRTFVDNLYKLAAAKLATEADLEKLRGELEMRLDDMRRELEGLKNEVGRQELKEYLRIGWLEDLEGGKIYRNVFVKGGKLYIRVRGVLPEGRGLAKSAGGEYVEREVVAAGVFSKWAEALRSRGGFVVLTGPRGVGKSTLASWHLWQMLKSGEVTSVIAAEGLEEPERRQDLMNLLDACDDRYRGVCGIPVVLYDPSPPTFYSELEATKAARKVEEVLNFLHTAVYKKRGIPVLAVVPKDLLTQEAKRAFGDVVYEVDVRTEGVKEFVAAVLREYSKPCEIEEEKALEIAQRIAEFDEGNALIARLAGERIRRDGCKIGDVEALLGEAQGNALAFIVRYVNDLLQVNKKRIKAYSRLLPIRMAFVTATMPGLYVMPACLLEEWMKWEEVYAGELIDREQEFVRTASRWLAAKHHDLIEIALAYITVFAAYPDEREVEEHLAKQPEPLREALKSWAEYGEKLQEELVAALAEPRLDVAASLFSERYGAQLVGKVERICRDGRGGEARPECWRRMALMAGAALTTHPFKALANAVEKMVGESGDVFRGLVEAAGQSGLDRLFLEGGELTPFSRALLTISALPDFPNSVYAAVADRYREIAEEAKALWQKWEERGRPSLPEAIYAVGLAALLAKAKKREKELGAEISVEGAEYALRAASFGVQRVLSPHAVSGVINALSPLGDLAPNQWTVILYNASQIETAVHEDEARLITDELDKAAQSADSDWAKAYLAEAYASLGEAEEACSLLDGIRCRALRTVAEAFVYNNLAAPGVTCNGVDVCKRLGEVAGELGKLAGKLVELKADEELMEYAKRRSPKPEKGLELLLKEALGLALSGSAKCAFHEGDFEKATTLFGQADEIFKSLESWKNYLTDRAWALRAKALASLPGRAEETLEGFKKLWGVAQCCKEPTAQYLSTAARILGEYLVALAFNRRYDEAAELLKEHGWLLGENPMADVATRLALRLLGTEAEPPSNKEVLEAVRGGVFPPLLPALAEALGVGWRGDVAEHCARCLHNEKVLCLYAFQAMRGDPATESEFVQWARMVLAEAGVPEELLRGADVRRLVEMLAPSGSLPQFILLIRAFDSGDVDTAQLHAEVGQGRT